MKKICTIFAVFLSLLILGGCASQKVIAEFDIPKNGRFITLPVQIAGKEYQFIVDTGATYCVLDETFRPSLGKAIKTMKVQTAGKPVDLQFYHSPEAYLGNVKLKPFGPVACADLEMLRRVTGLDFHGIIGMRVLGRYVVQIDFDRGKLKLIEPKGVAHPEWGQHVPISRSRGGEPTLKVQLPGDIIETFVVDTGCNSAGDLRKDIFAQVVREADLDTAETLCETVGSTFRSSMARIPKISIGNLTCRGLIFGEGNWSRLGLCWLLRFQVTFDFSCRRLYLKKGRQFERIREANMSGLHLIYIDAQVVVHSLETDSPASNAGVLAKDVIVAINGTLVSDLGFHTTSRLLRAGDKKKITLKVQRGEKELPITFELKKRI